MVIEFSTFNWIDLKCYNQYIQVVDWLIIISLILRYPRIMNHFRWWFSQSLSLHTQPAAHKSSKRNRLTMPILTINLLLKLLLSNCVWIASDQIGICAYESVAGRRVSMCFDNLNQIFRPIEWLPLNCDHQAIEICRGFHWKTTCSEAHRWITKYR